MTITPAYLEWREKTLQEGQRLVVENLLKARFGILDEELFGVVSSLLQLPPEEYSQALLQLSNLSHEELVSRFSR